MYFSTYAKQKREHILSNQTMISHTMNSLYSPNSNSHSKTSILQPSQYLAKQDGEYQMPLTQRVDSNSGVSTNMHSRKISETHRDSELRNVMPLRAVSTPSEV